MKKIKTLNDLWCLSQNLEVLYEKGYPSHLGYTIEDIIAYKYVTYGFSSPVIDGVSWKNWDTKIFPLPINYEIGKSYQVLDINKNILEQCGAGLNVATKNWIRTYKENHYIIKVLIPKGTLICIPINTDGKFRVDGFKVLKRIKWFI